MLSGDFELVDSDHEDESKAPIDEHQHQPSNSGEESVDSPVVAEKVSEDAKEETATQQPAITETTSEQPLIVESTQTPVDADLPAASDTPPVQPQPLKKSSSSKSARTIAKIAEPAPAQEAETSTGLLSKTSEIVSQAISSSEKVFSPHSLFCFHIR